MRVTPVVAVQSAATCAAGIVGLLVRSAYEPEVATACRVGLPDKSVYLPEVATAWSVGLLRIAESPLAAFQSAWMVVVVPPPPPVPVMVNTVPVFEMVMLEPA